MRDLILKFVTEKQGVTFTELSENIPGFSGDTHMSLGSGGNVLLWDALSPEAFRALKGLIDEDKIIAHPAGPLAYEIDGGHVPRIPTTNNPFKVGGYKTARWYPVCFSTHLHDSKP